MALNFNPDTSWAAGVLSDIQRKCDEQQFSASLLVINGVSLDIMKLALFTLADAVLHTAGTVGALGVAAVQLLIARPSQAISWASQAGGHGHHALAALVAAVLVPVPALVSAELAIRAYSKLGIGIKRGKIAALLIKARQVWHSQQPKIAALAKKAWASPHRNKIILYGLAIAVIGTALLATPSRGAPSTPQREPAPQGPIPEPQDAPVISSPDPALESPTKPLKERKIVIKSAEAPPVALKPTRHEPSVPKSARGEELIKHAEVISKDTLADQSKGVNLNYVVCVLGVTALWLNWAWHYLNDPNKA